MNGPLLLDLFCGAGGAAEGYRRAGFDVVGIDVRPQPRYPFEFVQLEALWTLGRLLSGYLVAGYALTDFAAIHASPPCQRYSKASRCRPGIAEKYPDLVGPTRDRLQATGKPYVIENVPGAPLVDPVWLCGCQFGCVTWWEGKGFVQLRRKRGFETTFPVPDPGPHSHKYLSVPVYGGGSSGKKISLCGPGRAKARREVMGIDWMQTDELDQAIPPVYTEHVGKALVKSIPVYGNNAPGNRPDLRGKGYAQAAREVMGIDWMRREELAESIPPVFTEYVGGHLVAHVSSLASGCKAAA